MNLGDLGCPISDPPKVDSLWVKWKLQLNTKKLKGEGDGWEPGGDVWVRVTKLHQDMDSRLQSLAPFSYQGSTGCHIFDPQPFGGCSGGREEYGANYYTVRPPKSSQRGCEVL